MFGQFLPKKKTKSARKVCKKTNEEKSIIDGFMYICVAEKCEMVDFFVFLFEQQFWLSVFAWRKKNKSDIKKFENIGADIGLLFQVADDLIDYKGSLLVAGKKTGKDKKKGKATLISLLGYKNTIKYADNLILKINGKLKRYGSKSRNLSETLNYILNRNK